MLLRSRSAAALLTLLVSTSAGLCQTAPLTSLGYSENFDSMGTAGTALPSGWRHFSANFGSNATWTNATGIPASGTNSMASTPATTASTVLAATTTPAGNNNNAFNAAASAGATADRVLATAPTTVAGSIAQLQIANNTGSDLLGGAQLTISFDTIRYTAAASANELPGYQVFISLDSTTWTNITPNPTITTVPNTVGTTQTSLVYSLSAPWAQGTTAYIRFVDDNAAQTSPDQIIGLNNVVITSSAGNPNGKCCFADGSCSLVTTGTCATGGVFTSGGICTPNTCPQPPQGSCCLVDGSCSITIQAACAGTWTSAGVCVPNTCPVLVVGLPATGYSQNFDALTSTGTTPPAGWQCRFLSGSHDTFSYAGSLATITTTFTPSSTSNAINVGQGASLLTTNNTLVAVTEPTTQGSGTQCYNLGLTATASDRCLGSSPTGIGAIELQLALRNDTGAPLSALSVAYDIRRFRGTNSNNTSYNASPYAAREEFPGYQLFFSLDNGQTFTNVSALNPTDTGTTGIIVPASAGVTNVPVTTFSLGTAVPPAGIIVLRWVDDNAQSPSPDQLIGLDNVQIVTTDPTLLGACCSSGNCTLTDDDACVGEVFLGLGTTCTPNLCPQPPSGSCCAADGSCAVTTQINCTTVWTLAGACTPNPCPGPLSACCAADGSCALVSAPAQCSAQGSFLVSGGVCTAVALCRQPGSTRFVAFGDYGVDNANQNAVAVRMKTFNPEFMVTTGDNTYNTSTALSNYDNTQAKYYGEFIKVANPASAYFAQYGNNVNRFFPSMGNHDFDIGGGAAGAIPYWNAYWELPGNERYYTFTRGPVDFFVLSSDGREPDSDLPGGTQYNWFINAYNASTSPWKIVVFHHPPYTNPSVHAGDAQMIQWNFQNLPGLTAVLNGHNHNMQRLELPRAGAGLGTGVGSTVPFMVTGAGGNSLYSITGTSPFNAFFNDSNFGFLLVDATPASISFRFVTSAGTVIDTRTMTLPGACCTAGACSITADSVACGAGSFQGNGTTCSPSPCAPVTGACCVGTACSVSTQGACVGSFQGVGVACGLSGNPTTCCKANYNGTNGVSVQDLFDFLAGWFNNSPAADINGVNGVTVQDIFDFMALWFAGC